MKLDNFINFLVSLDSTTKRLEMTEILNQMISQTPGKDIRKAIYLSLGSLRAPFEDLKFNFAEKQMMKTLAVLYQKDLSEIQDLYSKKGDLGTVAGEFCENTK